MKNLIVRLSSTSFLILFAFFYCMAQGKVTSLKAIASPESVENCVAERKVTITTTVRVTVDGPCVVKYKWLRSDGATDSQAPHTLVFKKAGTQSVTTEWNLWKKEFVGWQALETMSPNVIVSNKATFKIYCNQQTTQNCEEDCLAFNPSNLSINTEIKNNFRVVDGNHSMFGLRSQADAQKAINIIQHYKMNEICFVGRPGSIGTNVIMYFKTNGQAPQGSFNGEDCINFNPNTAEAKLVNGRWKVIDGNHWMFDFGTDAKAKDSAHKTVCIIKKYGFSKTCYVGRAFSEGRGMIYMKK